MMPELKPCPFCGKEPEMGVSYAYDGPYYQCRNCGYTLAPDDWNRRTPDLTEAPEWTRFQAALSAWRKVKEHKPVNAQDDYQGFDEFRKLRAAARGLVAWAYREAMLPPEDVGDLTEALARLKALEEKLRSTNPMAIYPHHFAEKWAKEIAAIRKALGEE